MVLAHPGQAGGWGVRPAWWSFRVVPSTKRGGGAPAEAATNSASSTGSISETVGTNAQKEVEKPALKRTMRIGPRAVIPGNMRPGRPRPGPQNVVGLIYVAPPSLSHASTRQMSLRIADSRTEPDAKTYGLELGLLGAAFPLVFLDLVSRLSVTVVHAGKWPRRAPERRWAIAPESGSRYPARFAVTPIDPRRCGIIADRRPHRPRSDLFAFERGLTVRVNGPKRRRPSGRRRIAPVSFDGRWIFPCAAGMLLTSLRSVDLGLPSMALRAPNPELSRFRARRTNLPKF